MSMDDLIGMQDRHDIERAAELNSPLRDPDAEMLFLREEVSSLARAVLVMAEKIRDMEERENMETNP